MKINNNYPQPFKSNMSNLSKGLYLLSHNDMLNASFIDIFAMDTPRTIIEFKNRGKDAGIEMGFREFTGTFIAEFSATVFALLFSKLYSRKNKEINPNSWATNSSIEAFESIFEKSDKTPKDFVKKSLEAMSGLSGNKFNTYQNPCEKTINKITKVITDKTLDKKESKKIISEVEDSIISSIKADNNIKITSNTKEFSSTLSHVLRDMTDLGKNVFFNDKVDYKNAIDKLKKLNKSRVAFAIPLSMIIAITNQYINRKLTKKRTGIDNFVGENDYKNNVSNKTQKKKEKGLIFKKLLSAGVFLAMLVSVMGLKKPSDLINKLEFNGPVTSGNTIKTIYGTLILGRIFASKDSTELREATVRDYCGFLSWLVLGGFVAKGVGQIFDKNQENLFNISKQGKGISHWLKNVSLKSQKEVLASGKNAAENIRKLNIAQISGIAYSAMTLGVLLPKLNIWMTKHNKKSKQNNKIESSTAIKNVSINNYIKNIKSGKINA